jgi:hypothetical protein
MVNFFHGPTKTLGRVSCSILGAFCTDSKCVVFPLLWIIFISFGQTVVGRDGLSTTTLFRALRKNVEESVARLEWAPNGGLGRAQIGKV